MNPYDKSLNETSPAITRVHVGDRGTERILALLDIAFEKGLADRFESFDEMLEAAEDVGYNAQGLRDYLRDQEFVIPKDDDRADFIIAVMPPGTKIAGRRMPAGTVNVGTIGNAREGLLFVLLLAPPKKLYAQAERRGRQFQAVAEGEAHILTEADMEEVRQHMIVCPDKFGCAIFMTQMAINAGIEMMAIAAGGRS